eukprot:TRINITY_DN34832_c0_g2_i1.p1 TRINITY_DN34832_c0_g2~~TRINITY_DN34832_c0_g2_i1.p1  ORF type:complete len:208 (-),score=15.03 TRINITY_DN34832_c0_g2_i1:383-1006(-)
MLIQEQKLINHNNQQQLTYQNIEFFYLYTQEIFIIRPEGPHPLKGDIIIFYQSNQKEKSFYSPRRGLSPKGGQYFKLNYSVGVVFILNPRFPSSGGCKYIGGVATQGFQQQKKFLRALPHPHPQCTLCFQACKQYQSKSKDRIAPLLKQYQSRSQQDAAILFRCNPSEIILIAQQIRCHEIVCLRSFEIKGDWSILGAQNCCQYFVQ